MARSSSGWRKRPFDGLEHPEVIVGETSSHAADPGKKAEAIDGEDGEQVAAEVGLARPTQSNR